MSRKTDISHWDEYHPLIEEFLSTSLRFGNVERLRQAMEYSLLAGGKRLRPMLTLEFCRICGGDVRAALPVACAVEMVHTYSLIHDDLPAMDDDVLRRGKPTCHVAFDEATAILAGDALQAQAFYTIATAELSHRQIAECMKELALAAGMNGMCGGQQMDLDGEGCELHEQELTYLQRLKTGALIQAACRMGVICADGTEEQLAAATAYATALALAFQIRDDMLDEIADEATLGKTIGSDRDMGKCTFLTLLGLDACAERVEALTAQAINAALFFTEGNALSELAKQLAVRVS